METPKGSSRQLPPRRVLGSLTGNGSSLNNQQTPKFSPPSNERDGARKASLQALTGERRSSYKSTPPGRSTNTMEGSHGQEIDVGDVVEVPGGITGVVKYVGGVEGKNGTFAGVELTKEYAARGKNDGDVEGIRYFTTTVPGSGIFLPLHRASKLQSPKSPSSNFPQTPQTPSYQTGNGPVKSKTPPTPSLPKFNQSAGPGARHHFSQTIGPGVRAPSPQTTKPKSRPSLPRPGSPLRKQNLQPQPTPGRASSRGSQPATSPAASSRVAKPTTPAPARASSRSQSRQGQMEFSPDADTPTSNLARPSMSKMRSLSGNRPSNANEEVTRLKHSLEERDKQLKEQAAALAEMESSLAELQTLSATVSAAQTSGTPEPGTENADANQLRAMIREKNEKIAMLTAEFDSHRADFRSTIDTLELASTETERVYEKRVQELLQEVEDLQNGREDAATVEHQLKQLEEVVQELEDGLEDARRGEAEAKGEVEFLRGEIERARLELRREREKAAKALKGAGVAVGEGGPNGAPSTPGGSSSRDLEQRDDEIRGLKAIIHSLSSGPDMGSPVVTNRNSLENKDSATSALTNNEEFKRLQSSVAALQREKSELQGLIDRKNFREEELERENANLRRGSSGGVNGGVAINASMRHEKTDSASTSTATMHTANRNSNTSATTAFRSGTRDSFSNFSRPGTRPNSNPNIGKPPSRPISAGKPLSANVPEDQTATSTTKPDNEEDHVADETEQESVDTTDSNLWCEMCEQSGHDILTCSKMFGDRNTSASAADTNGGVGIDGANDGEVERTMTDSVNDDESRMEEATPTNSHPNPNWNAEPKKEEEFVTAPTEPPSTTIPGNPSTSVAIPEGEGPAPGKNSGKIDMEKWCAMCERDGHESVDCPFEDF